MGSASQERRGLSGTTRGQTADSVASENRHHFTPVVGMRNAAGEGSCSVKLWWGAVVILMSSTNNDSECRQGVDGRFIWFIGGMLMGCRFRGLVYLLALVFFLSNAFEGDVKHTNALCQVV